MPRLVWIGEMIHYVHERQQCRMAFISGMKNPGSDTANIQVLFDGPDHPDDQERYGINRFAWKHAAKYNREVLVEGTWHLPSDCPYLKQAQQLREEQENNAKATNPGFLMSTPPRPGPTIRTASVDSTKSGTRDIETIFDEANPDGDF